MDIVLDLGSEIKGECTLGGKYKEKILCRDINLTAMQELDKSKNQHQTVHSAQIEDISLNRMIDMSSVSLLKALLTGQKFPTASIFLLRAGAQEASIVDEFITIEMKDVILSEHTMSASDSDNSESIKLAYNEIKIVYNAQNPTTGKKSGHISVDYDRLAGSVSKS